MAHQGPGHDAERGRVGFAQLLEQGAHVAGKAPLQEAVLHPGQAPAQVVPKPLQAAADVLHRRPVDAPVQGAEEDDAQAADDVLHQQEWLGPQAGGFGKGSAQEGLHLPDGLQGIAGPGLEGPVEGLHLLVEPGHQGRAVLHAGQDGEDAADVVPLLLEVGGPVLPELGALARAQGGGHGAQAGDEVQEVDDPVRLQVLVQHLPVRRRGQFPQGVQAVLEHQAHGRAHLAQAPFGELVQESEEEAEGPAEFREVQGLSHREGFAGPGLQEREEVAAADPKYFIQ